MGVQADVEELLSEDNMGTLFEDITSSKIDFDGLEEELNLFHDHEIISSIVRFEIRRAAWSSIAKKRALTCWGWDVEISYRLFC